MLADISSEDAQYLLGRPEFRRFLFAAIQSAGILSHEAPANGQTGRDLGHFEGRRSLGFEMLQAVHTGQPEPVRQSDPQGLATLTAAILEAMNPAPKGKTSGRRTDDTARYNDLGDD